MATGEDGSHVCVVFSTGLSQGHTRAHEHHIVSEGRRAWRRQGPGAVVAVVVLVNVLRIAHCVCVCVCVFSIKRKESKNE